MICVLCRYNLHSVSFMGLFLSTHVGGLFFSKMELRTTYDPGNRVIFAENKRFRNAVSYSGFIPSNSFWMVENKSVDGATRRRFDAIVSGEDQLAAGAMNGFPSVMRYMNKSSNRRNTS